MLDIAGTSTLPLWLSRDLDPPTLPQNIILYVDDVMLIGPGSRGRKCPRFLSKEQVCQKSGKPRGLPPWWCFWGSSDLWNFWIFSPKTARCTFHSLQLREVIMLDGCLHVLEETYPHLELLLWPLQLLLATESILSIHLFGPVPPTAI